MKRLFICLTAVCAFILFSCSPAYAPPSEDESGAEDAATIEKDVYNIIYSQDRDYFLACYSDGEVTKLGLFHFVNGENILLMDVSMGAESYKSCCLDAYTLYKIEYPYLYCSDIKSADVRGSVSSVSLTMLECDAGFDSFEAITCQDDVLYFQVERYVSAGNFKTETYRADVKAEEITAIGSDGVPSGYRLFDVDGFMSKLAAACLTDAHELPVVKSNIRLDRYGKIESLLIESNIDGDPVNILASFGARNNVSVDCIRIGEQSSTPSNDVSIGSFLHSVGTFIAGEDFIRNECGFYIVNYNDPVSLESYNISNAELIDAVEKYADADYQNIKDGCAIMIPFADGDGAPAFDGIKLIEE